MVARRDGTVRTTVVEISAPESLRGLPLARRHGVLSFDSAVDVGFRRGCGYQSRADTVTGCDIPTTAPSTNSVEILRYLHTPHCHFCTPSSNVFSVCSLSACVSPRRPVCKKGDSAPFAAIESFSSCNIASRFSL